MLQVSTKSKSNLPKATHTESLAELEIQVSNSWILSQN